MVKKTEILKKDSRTGRVYFREGVIVAFFMEPPIAGIVDQLQSAFDVYLDMIPQDVLRWESIGASSEEWKPFNGTTLQRSRAQLRKEPAAKRSLTSFELSDGNIGGDAPGYGIILIGEPVEIELPDQMCLLQLYFPPGAVAEDSVESFVRDITKLARILPYVSGYVSPALHWAELGQDQAIVESRQIVARHIGYDIQMNETGRTWLGKRLRGARWINFLGTEILERVGGISALRNSLPSTVDVNFVGHGAIIQAGFVPEIGDKARSVDTPVLRAIARCLEPVTAFQEVVLLGSFASWNKEYLEKWERRFLN